MIGDFMNMMHSRQGLWLLVLIGFALVLAQGRRLGSYFLSNLSALHLPDIRETRILQDQPESAPADRMRRVRASALEIDPGNISAQFQEFRWLRASGRLYEAARLVPVADRFEFSRLMPDYACLKATHYSQVGQWHQAISYYQLALSQTEAFPPAVVQADYYRALAHEVLESEELDESLQHYQAGKFFLLAGEPEMAAEQASRIRELGSGIPDAVSWAYLILAQEAYASAAVDSAVADLRLAIGVARNPAAGAMFLSLAQSKGDMELMRATKAYLTTLEPDWRLLPERTTCVQATWELAGFDLDTDILAAGMDVVLNLYWIPRCGEMAQTYGLVDMGSYWLQPGYVAGNVYMDSGFEWVLPEGRMAISSSWPGCCEVVTLLGEAGHVLRIHDPQFPATRASGVRPAPHLNGATYYLVGGRIRWGEVDMDGVVSANIGGWWIDGAGVPLPGFNTGVNLVQVFIVEGSKGDTLAHQSDWLKRAMVVRAPVGAAKFNPWLGLTSGAKGSAEVYFDDLFLVPLFLPGVSVCTEPPRG